MVRLWGASALAAFALVSAGGAHAQIQAQGPAQEGGHAPALRGPMLTWPGKVTHPMPRPPVMRTGDMRPGEMRAGEMRMGAMRPEIGAPVGVAPVAERETFTRRAAPPMRSAPSRYSASEGEWRAVPKTAVLSQRTRPVALAAADAAPPAPSTVLAGAPPRRALPTSIYDSAAPEPASADVAQAASPRPVPAKPAATGAAPVRTAMLGPPVRRTAYPYGVRLYSLHRQYGLTPDPAPIPPQFFATTADLSDPPGPLPGRTVAGTTTQAARARSEAATGTDTVSAQP